MSQSYLFPDAFLWGAATAAYQVEGAAAEEGRGPSIWDTFSHLPGRIAHDDNGDVSVDQYHRYEEDIQLMQRLGIQAYRFSVSWSRIFPEGDGAPNPRGVAYYDRLVDCLLAHGIQPWLTFYHWDLPQALEDRFGGWTSPEIADRFADYVAYMTEHISDRVSHFMTVNELCCIIDAGYGGGGFAPGRRLERGALNQARHHALLAHGKGVQAIRAHAKTPPTVGLAENFEVCIPVYESPEHLAAARTAMRLQNALRLTAILEGAYPEQALQAEGAAAPRFTDAEMRIIGAPLDFVGVNTYTPLYVRADATQPCGYSLVPHPPSYPHMASGWLFLGPQVTYWAPRWLAEIWQVPSVYITENGCSALDKLTSEGTVLDTDRVMYLRNHFISAHRAVSEGYPLHGYFVWSLLDNFEWADGYATRFGLTYVNYHTLQRTPKLSAEFYREVIAQRRVV